MRLSTLLNEIVSAPGLPEVEITGVTADSRRVSAGSLFVARNGFPARRMIVIGVTGTDGKTTTSSLLHHILELSGIAAGLVTSVGARIGAQQVDTGFPVPPPDPL